MSNVSPSLQIRELRVSTDTGLALKLSQFTPGINVIRGDNSTGRTTLLKLIEFVLGNPNLKQGNFIPEIQQCDRVVAEVVIADSVFTLERKFRQSRTVEVYNGTIEQFPRPFATSFSAGNDISEFLLSHLGIPSVAIVDEYSGRERSVTFNDILSLIYLDQESGFSRLHARLSKTQSRNVFMLLSGISIPETFELVIERESLKKRREELQKNLSAVEDFLQEAKFDSLAEVAEQRQRLNERREQVSTELSQVRQQVRSRPDYVDPLRNEILMLEQTLAETKEAMYYAKQTVDSYSQLEFQLVDDFDKSERALTANYILQSFEFQQCPRCLQAISDAMKDREVDGDCCLCGRGLVVEREESEDLERYQTNLQNQLAELSDLKELYSSRISELRHRAEALESEVANKRAEFDASILNYVSPVIHNIELLTQEVANIDAELRSLSERESWHFRIENTKGLLREMDAMIFQHNERLNDLRSEERSAANRLNKFRRFLLEFLEDTYPEPIDSLSLTPSSYLPVINGHRYDSRSATEKNIAIIGYYYAQLRFAIEESTYFPKFLMIDTFRQDDLERTSYERILEKFRDIGDRYGNTFQLILVVRDRVESLVTSEILQLTSGRHLLIF